MHAFSHALAVGVVLLNLMVVVLSDRCCYSGEMCSSRDCDSPDDWCSTSATHCANCDGTFCSGPSSGPLSEHDVQFAEEHGRDSEQDEEDRRQDEEDRKRDAAQDAEDRRRDAEKDAEDRKKDAADRKQDEEDRQRDAEQDAEDRRRDAEKDAEDRQQDADDRKRDEEEERRNQKLPSGPSSGPHDADDQAWHAEENQQDEEQDAEERKQAVNNSAHAQNVSLELAGKVVSPLQSSWPIVGVAIGAFVAMAAVMRRNAIVSPVRMPLLTDEHASDQQA